MPAATLIARFSATQTLPHVVSRLSALMVDRDATMKEFEEIIKIDPVLVARLLKLINSPFYGLVHRVDSIARAIAYLGMKNLHAIAVTQAIQPFFRDNGNATVFSRKQLWLHCAAVAICSKMVAERIFALDGEDAYLTGILHDFSLIIEEQVAPSTFLTVCRNARSSGEMMAAESRLFATDHCQVGALLTRNWNMPDPIQEAIGNHHTITDDIVPQSLTGILQMAEYLTAQIGYTPLPEFTSEISPTLIEHIRQNNDEYMVLLEDFPEEMAKARDLYAGEGN
ncbi:MAG: HDOD domain-containing protein [Desulfopila sp.]